MMGRVWIVAVCLLAGCGSSSGVMQVGPDAFRISSEAYSISGAETDVVEAATRHCASIGKQVNVTGMSHTPYVLGASYASATANFRCVPRSGT